MKRFLFLTVLVLGVASLTMFIGCSDDDNPVSLQQGDTTDASFQFVEDMISPEDATDFGTTFDVGFALLGSSGFLTSPAAKGGALMALQSDNDIIITNVDTFYITDDNWFVFAFSADEVQGTDTSYFTGRDSLQLLLDGVALDTSNLESGFNAIKTRVHVTGSESYGGSFGAHHRLEAEILSIVGGDSLIAISGTQNDTINGEFASDTGSCTIEMTENSSINNYQFMVVGNSDGDDCPQSGSITIAATIDLSCSGGGDSGLDQLNVNGAWTVTITINNNNTATISYSDGTTVWTITENLDCGIPG